MHVQFVKDLRIDDNPNIQELRFVAATARRGTNPFDTTALSNVDKSNYTVYINDQKTSQVMDSLTFAVGDEISVVGDSNVVFFPVLSRELNFGRAFYGQIKSALPTMSVDGINPTNALNYTFYRAEELTSIPENLFANNPDVTTFSATFQQCELLTSIPPNLFANNLDVTTFSATFKLCDSLTSIPPNLFANNHNVTSFYGTFDSCYSLESIPENLFANNPNVTDFIYTFWDCISVTGKLPELWITHPNATHDFCFENCTKASNYAAADAAGWGL